MKRRARWLRLLGWTMAAACSSKSRDGTLTVNGKDDYGHEVELSIRCERFDEVVAEGG